MVNSLNIKKPPAGNLTIIRTLVMYKELSHFLKCLMRLVTFQVLPTFSPCPILLLGNAKKKLAYLVSLYHISVKTNLQKCNFMTRIYRGIHKKKIHNPPKYLRVDIHDDSCIHTLSFVSTKYDKYNTH